MADSIFVLMAVIIFIFWIIGTSEDKKLARKTLTLEQYLSKYPHCKTDRGIKCVACDSQSIKNWGLDGVGDSRRVFICNHCNTRLYRSDNW